MEIKRRALELGFMACGISKAEKLKEEEALLTRWLRLGYHGKMTYMENHFEKRLDPRLLVPGAKSVVSLIYNYFPSQDLGSGKFKVAKYAYGVDYHYVIKNKLKQFITFIESDFGEISGRVFVDSAPVMERAWAQRSGLGWIGKHSLLLNKKSGSFFFIAELISDLELSPDLAVTDHCGTCTACIDACPTDAIVEDKVIDSKKCISYLTIELKDEIPASFRGEMNGWIFGCDICQDVCPWNRFSKPHSEPEFEPSSEFKSFMPGDWEELTKEVFGRIFKKSAVSRAGYMKLKKSVDFCKEDEREH